MVREVYSNPERARLVTEHVNLRGARAFADYLSLWMKRGELEPTEPLTTAQCLFGMLWSFLLSQEVMNQKRCAPAVRWADLFDRIPCFCTGRDAAVGRVGVG